MPSFRQAAVSIMIVLTLVSCRRDPEKAKKQYLESGNKYFDRGLYKQASIQYQNAIKIDRKFGPAHYKLAVLYLKEKPAQVAPAYKEFRTARELLKDNQAYQEEYKQSLIRLAELNIVFSYRDKTSLESVEGYCDELQKVDPNSFDLYRLRGDLAFTRGAQLLAPDAPTADKANIDALFDQAMVNYRKAEELKPRDPGIAMQLGMILEQKRQYVQAEPYFRKVIEIDKTAPLGYTSLYKLYMMQQKTDQAEQVLKEAIQNNPKTREFLERLAFHYGSLGRKDDMLNVLLQIKSHAKDFDAVYQVVGDFYLRMGDFDSALREYREGVTKDVKHKSNYQHSIVEVLLRQGKRAEAAGVNAQVLKDNPKDADAKSLAATSFWIKAISPTRWRNCRRWSPAPRTSRGALSARTRLSGQRKTGVQGIGPPAVHTGD